MFNTKWRKLGVIASLSLSLIAAGCGQEEAQSQKSVSEQMNYTITGIEAGAGQTETNEQAIAEYDSLAGWEQQTASTGAMLTELAKAIENNKPIIVAAWSPHFMFAKWDLKYLEDPKGIFGEEEHITTIVRKGLKNDMPKAHTILDRLQWDISEMESALLKAQEEELDLAKVAKQWVDNNQEKVAKWTEGVEQVDGTPIELALTPWDAEKFSTNAAKVILEQQGFDVTLTSVDPAIMFEAISSGDADASLSPWMPATHGALYAEYEGEFEDLGANLTGARIGLAVPAYMEIDSLADLEPAE